MRERIMNVMKKKEDNKGFTLVELIVVIVILAILAAILIPGLLRWIDKAKEEQYVLEARNVYLAVQAQIAEEYAKDSTTPPTADELTANTAIANLADLTNVSVTGIRYNATKPFEIDQMTVSFKSVDEKAIVATMDPNKTWTINSVAGKQIVAPPTYS